MCSSQIVLNSLLADYIVQLEKNTKITAAHLSAFSEKERKLQHVGNIKLVKVFRPSQQVLLKWQSSGLFNGVGLHVFSDISVDSQNNLLPCHTTDWPQSLQPSYRIKPLPPSSHFSMTWTYFSHPEDGCSTFV